ncbi:MAG: CYTH domain-containing protein [Bacteroidetes bacterium]|nr:CYTH domain-containing protein [Bacteroidota bacterium]
MPCNLELKSKVENFDSIIKALNALGAKEEMVLNQCDVYYDYPDFKLKLRIQNGKNHLIKYLRDESGPDRWSNYDILHLEGSDPRSYLADFLKESIVVEKVRILYIYKNTRIHLDDVKELGLFIELETIMDKGEADAQQRFNFLVNELKLDLNNQIKMGYKELKESK